MSDSNPTSEIGTSSAVDGGVTDPGSTGGSASLQKKGITLTDSAVARLKQIIATTKTPETAGMRIAVRGGGCSGMTYAMDMADAPKERDKVFERDGARVFVDSKSYLYLAGTELTFEESFMASMFKLNNPNQKAACGCGVSFSV